eukprot:1358707-Amorphochlora_amoeboformis.AAC.1
MRKKTIRRNNSYGTQVRGKGTRDWRAEKRRFGRGGEGRKQKHLAEIFEGTIQPGGSENDDVLPIPSA